MREHLADDDGEIGAGLVDGGDRRLVAVAVADELEKAGRDPRLDAADDGIADSGGQMVTLDREVDRVARRERREHARSGEVDEPGAAGLAHLLDEHGGRCLARSALAVLRWLLRREQHAQPLHVALCDAVGRVTLERLLVGLKRFGVAAELCQRLAQPVAGIDVGAELEELAVGVDGGLPLTARGMRDGGIGQLPTLSGGGIGFSKRHERCERLRMQWGDRPNPAESALLYHRP